MEKNKERIAEILDSMGWLLDAHDSSAVLVEIKDNTAIIHLTGQCADCDTNCIEDALHKEMPDMEFIFQGV